MGWDINAVDAAGNWILPPEHLAVFEAASKQVFAQAGAVDGDLADGGLDCSPCARAIEEMCGLDAWGDSSPEQVAEAFARAKVPDDLTDDNKWEYLSAWHFLRVCTELGLGAHASY